MLKSCLYHISGAVGSRFYLVSDHYVSDLMLEKIDQTTSSMMESGLHAFYLSLTAFKQKCIEHLYLSQTDDDFRALTSGQLRRPMIFIFGLWSIAIIFFIAEIIILKWKNRGRR